MTLPEADGTDDDLELTREEKAIDALITAILHVWPSDGGGGTREALMAANLDKGIKLIKKKKKNQSVSKRIVNITNKCGTCLGYGLWAIGDATPVGPIDSSDGVPTNPCPACGADGTH